MGHQPDLHTTGLMTGRMPGHVSANTKWSLKLHAYVHWMC